MTAYKNYNKSKTKTPDSIKKRHSVKAFESSGNVFKDMGKGDDEANNLLLRSDLMIAIERIIKDQGWTQARAAKLMGLAQPRIAELCSGRIDLFTIDTLIKYLNKLGKEVTINIHNSKVA
jgi:predicted XRE-type DNA-binding protein